MEVETALVRKRARDGWRHTLVALALGVVALSFVGMHQLSLGHMFVTPSRDHHHAAAAKAPRMAHADHAMAASAPLPTSSRAMSQPLAPPMSQPVPQPGPQLVGHESASYVSSGTGVADDGCTGCAGHVMGLGSCVLALTLLVLFWWLRLPQPRHLPPQHRRHPRVVSVVRRELRTRALSLVELSILRT